MSGPLVNRSLTSRFTIFDSDPHPPCCSLCRKRQKAKGPQLVRFLGSPRMGSEASGMFRVLRQLSLQQVMTLLLSKIGPHHRVRLFGKKAGCGPWALKQLCADAMWGRRQSSTTKRC